LRPAKVIWRGRENETPYSAYIDRVGSEVDATTGGVNLYAKIETGGAETILRPGAFVEVYIDDAMFEGVARLPAAAIYDESAVYVVKDGRLEARKIKVEARIGGDMLVSGALESGDMVATTKLPEISNGLKVEIQ
jgi:multidrug efflux pump subunit AcrA (membrane-fusion protein)